MTVLNLGCGNKPMKNVINHDMRKHRKEVDVVWNLNKRPWPWKANEFDTIFATSVFEHLQLTLIETLNECWRIVKPGGKVRIKVPIHTSPNIRRDPTHRWFWSSSVFDFVDPTTKFGQTYNYYTPHKWKILTRKQDKKKWNYYVVLQPIKGK